MVVVFCHSSRKVTNKDVLGLSETAKSSRDVVNCEITRTSLTTDCENSALLS